MTKPVLLPQNTPIHIMAHIFCSVCAIQDPISFIEYFSIFCIHGEVCARIERDVKFERLKISSFFAAIRLVLSDWVIYMHMYILTLRMWADYLEAQS